MPTQFQLALCAPPNQDTPPSVPYALTSFGTEVFEAIWGNVLLRGNLFPGLDYANTPIDELKPLASPLFVEMISQTTNAFYNFIKVK